MMTERKEKKRTKVMELVLLITGSSIIHRKLCVATTVINVHALGRFFNQFSLKSTHTRAAKSYDVFNVTSQNLLTVNAEN